MKKLLAFVTILGLVIAAGAFAGDSKSGHTTSAKSASWTGEIVDAGCYISKGAMGAKHAECALKCASEGMPLMLLGKDGKAILLTPNHNNPDAYEQVKKMAGSMATVTGTMAERGGVKGIDVTAVAAATTTTTTSTGSK
jgi:hypothetical protein